MKSSLRSKLLLLPLLLGVMSCSDNKDEIPDISNNVALTEYKDLNDHEDLTWLTLFFNARAQDKLSEEELLTIYSKEYAKEKNAFKKQALAQVLMPKINAELTEYQKDYRVTLPVGKSNDNLSKIQDAEKRTDIFPHLPPLQSYDFETKSFPIEKCHFPFMFGQSNEQKVKISVQRTAPEEGCTLYVDDQKLANKIEAAIVDNEVAVKGDVYYVLSTGKNGKLTSEYVDVFAYPVFAKIVYFNEVTNEELIAKEFNFS